MTLRIAFLGNDPWSVPTLEAIADAPDLTLELVVTNPPKAAGRGSRHTPTAVAIASRAWGTSFVEAQGVREGAGADALADVHADVIVVVAYGELLTPATMGLAPHGALNLHFSLLPRWRGAAPVQWALIGGDHVTGVTVMLMDEGLDTGPIVSQRPEQVRPQDDAGSLGGRLAISGASLMVEVLRSVSREGVTATPQDPNAATTAPRITKSERVLDWSTSGAEIVRWVRALAPQPGATTTLRGGAVKVLAAEEDDGGTGEPGAIIAADASGVLVATRDGGVRLLVVAPAGRRRMDAAAWARGARFAPGEHLG